MEEMNKLIVEKVIKATLEEIKLKNGKAALSIYGDFTHLHINPTGKFIIGGPAGRCRPHGPQDHHRHLRRLGCPRWWRFLWQGPIYGDFTHLHINPTGKFIIGGPQGDAGLTG